MRRLKLLLAILGLIVAAAVMTEWFIGPRADFVVSFGSVCCGPDMAAMLGIDDLLAEHERRHPGRAHVRKMHWGLEGEVDYCVFFTGLSWREGKEFTEAARAIVRRSSHHTVEVKESGVCVPGWNEAESG